MTWRLDARAVRVLLGLLAVAVVWTAAATAVRVTHGRDVVAAAATIDFSVTAAVVLWLVAVRGGHLPRWTLGVTAALGLAVARARFAHGAANAALTTAALVDVAMTALLLVRGRRALRGYRAARARGAAFTAALPAGLEAAGFPPRLAHVLATELAIVAAVATGWRRPAPAPLRFTVHRLNGWSLYAGVLVASTLVETALVHVLLALHASPTIAWVATALSLYSVAWLVGDALALRHGGITVAPDALDLALGIRARARIPWADVARVEAVTAAPPSALDLSILGANVVVHLRAPHAVVLLLGRRRTATALALSVDDLAGFCAAVTARGADRASPSAAR